MTRRVRTATYDVNENLMANSADLDDVIQYLMQKRDSIKKKHPFAKINLNIEARVSDLCGLEAEPTFEFHVLEKNND